jgi:hypothetical protein
VPHESRLKSNGLTRQPFRPAEDHCAPANPGQQGKETEGDHAKPVKSVRRATSQRSDARNGQQNQRRQQQQGWRTACPKADADHQQCNHESEHRQGQRGRCPLAPLCPERPAGERGGWPGVPREHQQQALYIRAGVAHCRRVGLARPARRRRGTRARSRTRRPAIRRQAHRQAAASQAAAAPNVGDGRIARPQTLPPATAAASPARPLARNPSPSAEPNQEAPRSGRLSSCVSPQ